MPTKALREFLDTHHVKYVCIDHAPSYTAQEIVMLREAAASRKK